MGFLRLRLLPIINFQMSETWQQILGDLLYLQKSTPPAKHHLGLNFAKNVKKVTGAYKNNLYIPLKFEN